MRVAVKVERLAMIKESEAPYEPVPDTGQYYYVIPASGYDFRLHRYSKTPDAGIGVKVKHSDDRRRRHQADVDFRRDKQGLLIVRLVLRLSSHQYPCDPIYCLAFSRSGEPVTDKELGGLCDYLSENLFKWLCTHPHEPPDFVEDDMVQFSQRFMHGPALDERGDGRAVMSVIAALDRIKRKNQG